VQISGTAACADRETRLGDSRTKGNRDSPHG
jgi:hypothetical protein